MTQHITRIKKSQTTVPENLRQANILLAQLGGVQDQINAIEQELAKKIADLKAEAEKKVQPLALRRDIQINALFTFANPRKAELTKDVRSVVLDFGTFGWRLTTPRVEIEGTEEATIATLKATGNKAFVRIIEEVNRQLLLEKRPVISGISYAQSDEFFVVPTQKGKKAKTFTRAIDREKK